MFSRRLLISSIALAAASLPGLAQTVSPTLAFTTNYTFPPLGVSSTETLQVNLANTATSVTTFPGVTPATPACTGNVTITNASGQIIGKATPFSVGANVIQSVTVPYGSLGATGGARAVVLVSIQRTFSSTPASTPAAPCNLSYSLETYLTTTGETHILLTNNEASTARSGIFVFVPPSPGGNGGNN